MPLTQKMTQRAPRRGISYVCAEKEGAAFAAVPVLNPVKMCGVKYTPKHSRADGCTHALHVEQYNIN